MAVDSFDPRDTKGRHAGDLNTGREIPVREFRETDLETAVGQGKVVAPDTFEEGFEKLPFTEMEEQLKRSQQEEKRLREELARVAERKKKNKKRYAIIGGTAAVLTAGAAVFVGINNNDAEAPAPQPGNTAEPFPTDPEAPSEPTPEEPTTPEPGETQAPVDNTGEWTAPEIAPDFSAESLFLMSPGEITEHFEIREDDASTPEEYITALNERKVALMNVGTADDYAAFPDFNNQQSYVTTMTEAYFTPAVAGLYAGLNYEENNFQTIMTRRHDSYMFDRLPYQFNSVITGEPRVTETMPGIYTVSFDHFDSDNYDMEGILSETPDSRIKPYRADMTTEITGLRLDRQTGQWIIDSTTTNGTIHQQ